MFQQKYLSQKTCQEHEILLVDLEGRDREQQLLINQMKVDIKIKEAMIDRLKVENAKLKDKLEEMEEEIKVLEGELRKVESLEEMEEMIAVVKQKNERVEELEEALRQSVAITSDIETEKIQDRSKMKQITDKLEKLEYKLQRAKDQRSREGPCPECAELRLKLRQTTDELASVLAERRQHLEELFRMKHDALMSALSEKDAHLALLEEAGLRTPRAQQEYKRLTQARAAVLRAIQRQDECQVKLLADLPGAAARPQPSGYIPTMEIYRSEKTPSTEGDDDVFTPPKAAPDDGVAVCDVLSPGDRSSSQSSEDSVTMPEDSDHEDTSGGQHNTKSRVETRITHRPLKVGESGVVSNSRKFADDGNVSLHQFTHKSDKEADAKSGVNLRKQLARQPSASDPKSQVPILSSASDDFASASNASSSTLYYSLPKDDREPGSSSARESIDTLAETDFFSLSENTAANSCSIETETKTEVESLSATEDDTGETSSASEAGSLLDPDHLDDIEDLSNPKIARNENDEPVDDQRSSSGGNDVKLHTSINVSRIEGSASSPHSNVCSSDKKEPSQVSLERGPSMLAATRSLPSPTNSSCSTSDAADRTHAPCARASAQRMDSPNEEFLTEL